MYTVKLTQKNYQIIEFNFDDYDLMMDFICTALCNASEQIEVSIKRNIIAKEGENIEQ